MSASLRRPAAGRMPRFGPLRDLPRPSAALSNLGPNWFAAVMGTGIVANAAVTPPIEVRDLRAVATVVWLLRNVTSMEVILQPRSAWRITCRSRPPTC